VGVYPHVKRGLGRWVYFTIPPPILLFFFFFFFFRICRVCLRCLCCHHRLGKRTLAAGDWLGDATVRVLYFVVWHALLTSTIALLARTCFFSLLIFRSCPNLLAGVETWFVVCLFVVNVFLIFFLFPPRPLCISFPLVLEARLLSWVNDWEEERDMGSVYGTEHESRAGMGGLDTPGEGRVGMVWITNGRLAAHGLYSSGIGI
jgi:hypothetical protein